jgi:hypothetical protein
MKTSFGLLFIKRPKNFKTGFSCRLQLKEKGQRFWLPGNTTRPNGASARVK